MMITWEGTFLSLDSDYITAFTVLFAADNAGQPGTLLYSNNIAGNANETLSALGNRPIYDYSVDLPNAFSATGGAQYWLSVQPTLTFSDPLRYWYWIVSYSGDGLSFQSGNPSYDDLTFGLHTVPEPGPLSFALLGGLILLYRRRHCCFGG